MVSRLHHPSRTVAILSPHFPPATLAGVHRARHLAKHLPAFGWAPIIVRTHEKHYTERLDPMLAALVPENVQQVRAAAIPASLARIVGVGDIGLRGFLGFYRSLTAISRSRQIDAVMITGSPFYPMLLAGYIRERLDIPVILDFQDPWVSSEGATRHKWTKGGVAHRLAVALEPTAVRHANFITSVSARQNDEMIQRYPWLDRDQMAAIPIGGDPDDFIELRSRPSISSNVKLNPCTINLSYVGTFLPRAEPLVRLIFRALRSLRATQPQFAEKMRLHFVGTSNQPGAAQNFGVLPIAEEEGVRELVFETPQRVPYLEALSIIANSDGLLLIGSDEPHYTASKIYPALISAKPYLSIFHAASSAHEILSRAKGGLSYSFRNRRELIELQPDICAAFEKFARGAKVSPPDQSTFAPYLAKNIAGAFSEVFESIVESRN